MPDNTDVFEVDLRDLWELYTKKNASVIHAETCQDENCERCEILCDDGYIISCDGCGRLNHRTWKLWQRIVDSSSGGCSVFCPNCKRSIENDIKNK